MSFLRLRWIGNLSEKPRRVADPECSQDNDREHKNVALLMTVLVIAYGEIPHFRDGIGHFTNPRSYRIENSPPGNETVSPMP
jgi:hypothetical protein